MITLEGIHICYQGRVLIEHGDMSIPSSSITLIHGASGIGKTSLLYRVGLLSEKHDFQYHMNGTDLNQLKPKDRAMLKRKCFGYVLQNNALFEQYDVLGNLKLYAELAGIDDAQMDYKAWMIKMGLHISLHQSIASLSGGEQQRLAILCALLKRPDVLILDEPTSALDHQTEIKLLQLLQGIAHDFGVTVILASHSETAAMYADTIYKIENRCIVKEKEDIHQPQKRTVACHHESIPKLRYTFFLQYISYFNKKYKKWNRILSMGILCSILCVCFSVIFGTHYMNQSMIDLTKLHDRVILIAEARLNADSTPVSVSAEQMNIVEDKVGDHVTIFPYNKTVLQIQEKQVLIIPYFHQEQWKDALVQVIEHNVIDGSYISYPLYESLGSNVIHLNYLNKAPNYVYLESYGIQEQMKLDLKMDGILQRGVKPEFIASKEFVSIYYEKLQEEYSYHTMNQATAYFIACDSIDDYIDTIAVLDEEGLPYIEQTIDAAALEKSLHDMSSMKELFWIIVVAFFVMMQVILQLNYDSKRKYEYTLLKINGVHTSELAKLTCLEFLLRNGKAALLGLILMVPIYGISAQVLELQGISIILPIASLFLLDLLLPLPIIIILEIYLLHRHAPEKTLRN